MRSLNNLWVIKIYATGVLIFLMTFENQIFESRYMGKNKLVVLVNKSGYLSYKSIQI